MEGGRPLIPGTTGGYNHRLALAFRLPHWGLKRAPQGMISNAPRVPGHRQITLQEKHQPSPRKNAASASDRSCLLSLVMCPKTRDILKNGVCLCVCVYSRTNYMQSTKILILLGMVGFRVRSTERVMLHAHKSPHKDRQSSRLCVCSMGEKETYEDTS